MNVTHADVAIIGGGLAGLTLAIQLKQQDPDIAVTVFERRQHPVREAAFKVGESTVEIGAHYFADVLGLRDHLDSNHIRKFGFRFFFSEGQQDIDRCTELGVSQALPASSWQIDRGRFENFLGTRARELGVRFIDHCTVRGVDLADQDNTHVVRFQQQLEHGALQARWVIDASGRAGLLKRKLGLAKDNAHNANAVWWRVEGLIDPNDWSSDPSWLQRCAPPERWRSTNHMCGPGYWFWLIPLSSGAHSLGIVCDAQMHPLETMNTHDKAMDWLRLHQPKVAHTLDQHDHPLQDFLFLRNFSYSCKQVFSADRWALTGEAGLFLDPFYSPGSDFIAISNTYICELIEHDRAGKPFDFYAELYQQLYFSFYDNMLTLYQDQYAIFGDPHVMPLKVIWDYTYYWSLLAPLYFTGHLKNIVLLNRLKPELLRARAINLCVQALLRDWSARNPEHPQLSGRLLDQYHIDWFRELNRALEDRPDATDFARRVQQNVQRMSALADELLHHARLQHPDISDHGLASLLPQVTGEAMPSLDTHWYPSAA